MKEALGSSETSVLTRATWRIIPEDTILQFLYCSFLNSSSWFLVRHSATRLMSWFLIYGKKSMWGLYVVWVLSTVGQNQFCLENHMSSLQKYYCHLPTKWHFYISLKLCIKLKWK
jgi:hypothetical protein